MNEKKPGGKQNMEDTTKIEKYETTKKNDTAKKYETTKKDETIKKYETNGRHTQQVNNQHKTRVQEK